MDIRDMHGNRVSNSSTSLERLNAGVKPEDSRYLVDLKVEGMRLREASVSTVNLGHFYLWLIILSAAFLLYVGVRFSIERAPKWLHEYQDFKQQEAHAEEQARRRSLFSDFSTPAEWPTSLQTAARAGAQMPLITLVEECRLGCAQQSRLQRAQTGMRIWSRIASDGEKAKQTLWEDLRSDRFKYIQSLAAAYAITFLRDECAKGTEVACQDLAKGYASTLFPSTVEPGSAATTRLALSLLPPTAVSPQTQALRKRIKDFQ